MARCRFCQYQNGENSKFCCLQCEHFDDVNKGNSNFKFDFKKLFKIIRKRKR